jgi:DNA-directed RNA polymerase, mitochondrial
LREGKCRLSAPPNVIHSLEASHLVFVALACEKAGIPLVTVHDCFATLGCHVDDLREIWLEELRKMYGRENLLQEIYDDARKALGPNATLPLIPKRGTLSLKKLNGRYPIG